MIYPDENRLVTAVDVTIVHDTYVEERTVHVVEHFIVDMEPHEVLSPGSRAMIHQILETHRVAAFALHNNELLRSAMPMAFHPEDAEEELEGEGQWVEF